MFKNEVRPRDVLTQQADLAEQLLGRNLSSYIDQLARLDGLLPDNVDESLAPALADCIRSSRAYQIAGHMTPKIMARANSLDRTEAYGNWTDGPDSGNLLPPWPQGFAVFEVPLSGREVHGWETLVHVLTWSAVISENGIGGWLVSLWNDLSREPDEVMMLETPENRQRIGRWSGLGTHWVQDGLRVGPVYLPPSDEQRANAEREGWAVNGEGMNPYRWIAAVWQMLGETIPAAEPGHIDRAARRQAQRARIAPEVTVITLRRESHPVQNPGSGKPLEHRVQVEPHVRHVWVGRGADRHLEPRTIAAHWRGPEGGDVRNTPKVHRLTR